MIYFFKREQRHFYRIYRNNFPHFPLALTFCGRTAGVFLLFTWHFTDSVTSAARWRDRNRNQRLQPAAFTSLVMWIPSLSLSDLTWLWNKVRKWSPPPCTPFRINLFSSSNNWKKKKQPLRRAHAEMWFFFY